MSNIEKRTDKTIHTVCEPLSWCYSRAELQEEASEWMMKNHRQMHESYPDDYYRYLGAITKFIEDTFPTK